MGFFNPFKYVLGGMLKTAFNGFAKLVEDSVNILTFTLSAPGAETKTWIDNAWTMVETISNAINPFCQTVIALCLLIELAQTVMKVDVLKWEHGLKICIKIVLSKVCIDVAPVFLKACYQQAIEWIIDVSNIGLEGNVDNTGQLSLSCSNMLEKAESLLADVDGAGAILSLFMTVVIVIVAINICGLLVKVIALGRTFEILVYLAISPLPCAFFPLGDGTGGGMSRITLKYFKSFIAVCLQGVMMLVCIKVYNIIIASVLNEAVLAAETVGEVCYTMLMGSIVLVMSVARCGSWAKSIIDAM